MNKQKLKELRDFYEHKAHTTRNDFEMALTAWDMAELIDALLAEPDREGVE